MKNRCGEVAGEVVPGAKLEKLLCEQGGVLDMSRFVAPLDVVITVDSSISHLVGAHG